MYIVTEYAALKLNSLNIGIGKHFSYRLNSHFTSDWCTENLKELPFKCPNEQMTATFWCFIQFFI